MLLKLDGHSTHTKSSATIEMAKNNNVANVVFCSIYNTPPTAFACQLYDTAKYVLYCRSSKIVTAASIQVDVLQSVNFLVLRT